MNLDGLTNPPAGKKDLKKAEKVYKGMAEKKSQGQVLGKLKNLCSVSN